MTASVFKSALSLAVICSMLSGSAWARGNDWTIKDGKGEELSIKHGWFGRKQVKVQDRLGNKLENKKGLWGSKETQVDLLGNQIKRKKGIFGGSQIEGSSILGDKITTKKGLFGRRQTTVDVSGVSSAIGSLLKGSGDSGKIQLPEVDGQATVEQQENPSGN